METRMKKQLSKYVVTKAALALGLSCMMLGGLAHAQAIGPDPTEASLAADGPFAVSTQTIRSGGGFAGGTVYSPNTPGKYAVVAFCPGFTNSQSAVQPLGRRLATHGFVVVTMNTNSTLDFPASRATQIIAALNRVTALTTGPVAGKMDTTRRVASGYSMGGGGALIAAKNNASLKAAVGFAPWSSDKNFASDTVPSAMIAGSSDTTAPPGSHATTFYNSIPNSTKKLLAIISGATHSAPIASTPNQPGSKYQISWVKRFADNDARYSPFLVTDSRLSSFSANGPF
jgi:dienelactone hydrolase